MRKHGLAIDPGMSTGVVLFSWGDEQDEYFRQEAVWQFTGGAAGLAKWMDDEFLVTVGRAGARIGSIAPLTLSAIVVEKFTPRSGGEFSLTQDSVEPLRCEGVLIGRGLQQSISWQQPSSQYFMGNSALPLKQKKKLSREFLKLNGLHLTGKHVGQPDADDAISAELHAIAWLRRARHMPTMVELFPPDED